MFSPDKWFTQTGFYNGVTTQSLRFAADDSAYLSRDFGSGGNRRKYTVSFWVKRAKLDADAVGGGQDNHLFSATSNNGNDFTTMRFVSQSFTTEKDIFQIYTNTSGVADYSFEAQSSFRDVNAWYHFVVAVDTEQSTAANRVRFYVNGVQRTATKQYYAQIPEDYDTFFNTDNSSTGTHEIGRSVNDNGRYFDGYLADFNFVDGIQISSTSRTNTAGTTEYVIDEFGEFKGDVWIPKSYTGSYGTTGYRLEFKNTTNGAGSASTIGADTSGNGNHWTSNNFGAHDSNMPDSPENCFAIMDNISFPLTPDNISQGNLRVGKTDQSVHASSFKIPSTGKWYWEANIVSSDGSNYYCPYVGVCTYDFYHAEQDISSSPGDTLFNTVGVSHMRGNDAKYKNITASSTSNGTNTGTEGQAGTEQGILSFALDADAGTLKYYWNNSLIRTDSTLTAGVEHFPICIATNSGSNVWNYVYFNFGQDSSFAGTKTAAGNKDINQKGDFYYAVPSGHLALCNNNLPEVTLGPNSDEQAGDHHETIIYDGDGNDDRTISGVGFKPDWVWIKNLSTNGYDIIISDSSRGGDRQLITTSGGNYTEDTATNKLESFAPDGFVLGQSIHGSVNENGARHVAWNWKVNGGSTSANTDGSGATIASTVQANQTAGFSIVTWSGNETSGAKVAHGLSSAPEVVITKCRSHAASFVFGIGGMSTFSTNDYLSLNSTNAKASLTNFYQAYGADTFSVGVSAADEMNRNTGGTPRTYVSYVFHSVEGYSKFGQYTANGNADGPMVVTGFRPAWVMIKNTSNTNNWFVVDDTRMGVGLYSTQQINPVISYIEVDDASANKEFDSVSYPLVDFLSTGFKVRNGGTGSTLAQDVNRAAGDIYFYMAFAHSPFKFANAF